MAPISNQNSIQMINGVVDLFFPQNQDLGGFNLQVLQESRPNRHRIHDTSQENPQEMERKGGGRARRGSPS
uniref:Uncharacterized protein n=1 Tax=Arundo donax TaxID=35708 RepID=A0A0A9A1X6_ARUDO